MAVAKDVESPFRTDHRVATAELTMAQTAVPNGHTNFMFILEG